MNDVMIGSDLDTFKKNAQLWLAQHAPAFSGKNRDGLSQVEDLERARQWQALKAGAGYASISLPREYGGGGKGELEKIIFATEEIKYDLPTDYFAISLNMPIPMLLRYGSDNVKQSLVPPAIRGDQIWCQLFSEPSAGSDLAAIRLRARKEGDGWVLNGQKLWTSWAQYADWGIIVARTNPNVKKHAGLTFFFLNMKSPGIEVKNIRKLAGESEVNEVFFTDVYVPDTQRMGAVGDGFKVAIETLMIERYAVIDEATGGPSLEDFYHLAKSSLINDRVATEDASVRKFIADTAVERQGLRNIHQRALLAMSEGREAGPEGSIRKLLLARRRQALSELALDLLGPEGLTLSENSRPTSDFACSWIDAPGARIAGGTDEILRNTIAEKILGLPQDYRPDKSKIFSEL